MMMLSSAPPADHPPSSSSLCPSSPSSSTSIPKKEEDEDEDQQIFRPPPSSPPAVVVVAPQRRRRTTDDDEGWRRGTRRRGTTATTTTEAGAGGGGMLAMLQRAFCAHFSPFSSASTQYRTVLTRESQDSGLELDEMEAGNRAESSRRARGKKEGARERGEEAEEREEMLGGEEGAEKSEQERGNGAGKEEEEGTGMENGAGGAKKRRSLGRLVSSLLSASPFPSGSSASCSSVSPSPARHSMFDFSLSGAHSPLFATSAASPFGAGSPITQLSHSNQILVQDNERLGNRVRELELMLRDHVAHLNSIYHTLHRLHGFQALQLPDGELVPLSRFQGFPLQFVRAAIGQNGTETGDDEQKQLMGQARRIMMLQQQQQRHAEGNSLSSGGSAGSSSSFASSASAASDSVCSAPLDPADLSQAMMRRLCIRPVAGEDGDEMQAFMDWLKSGGADPSAANHSIEKHADAAAATAKKRAVALREMGRRTAVQFQSADAECGGGTANGRAAREKETGTPEQTARRSTISTENGTANGVSSERGNGTPVPAPHRSHRQPPVYSVMSKSQRIRTQYPSMSSSSASRRSPLLSSASVSGSASPHHHHGGIGGGGGGGQPLEEQRSPRRMGIGGIGTNMGIGRMGARASDAYRTQVPRRNLI